MGDMRLSAEQFAELLSSFGPAHLRRKFDSRRAARVELHAQIKISMLSAGQRLEPANVMTCDFSARGLSFVNDTTLTIGQQFITEMPRRGGGNVEILCSVVRVNCISSDAFRIGAEFICTVPVNSSSDDGIDTSEVARIRESMLS